MISRWILTCDRVHSWSFYNAAPLGARPSHQHHDPISHPGALSWHWANQPIPYPNNAERLNRKQQVSIFKSLVWLDQGSNPWVWICRPPKTRNRCLTQSAIPSGQIKLSSEAKIIPILSYPFHNKTTPVKSDIYCPFWCYSTLRQGLFCTIMAEQYARMGMCHTF